MMSRCPCGSRPENGYRLCRLCDTRQHIQVLDLVQQYTALLEHQPFTAGAVRAAGDVLAGSLDHGADGALLLLVDLGPGDTDLTPPESPLYSAAISLAYALRQLEQHEDSAVAINSARTHLRDATARA